MDWTDEIRKRTRKVPISSGRSNKAGRIGFDDIVFVPGQLKTRPVDYFREEISGETVMGKKSRKPMRLRVPIVMGAMSFGALSKEAKTALAIASTESGSAANTGEGGMLEEERDAAERLIIQYSTGRFGITDEVLVKADAIEIKIGQGAKPGSGGLLPKEKITDEIAKVRGVSGEEDIHSPAYHRDIKDGSDLKRTVDRLREVGGGVPIIIKLGAGDVENDVRLAVEAGPDVIAVDGMEGGTGAAPEVMLDEVGIPTIPALVRARRTLDEIGSDTELWIGGGFNKGGDMAKAIALGANGIFLGFPMLVAMGCIHCRLCYLGKCSKGIATQDPALRGKLDVRAAAQDATEYIKNCTEEIKMVSGAVGKNDIHKLGRDDIRAMTSEMVAISGIKPVFGS